MSLNTWNLYKRGFKEQAAQRARFPPPSVGHMPANKGEQEARTFGPLKLFTCISKTDYASLLNEDMLNPLNCNWRENYYSTSILCSLISLSIFIKIKSSDLEKLLGGNWEIRRFFFCCCCSWKLWQLLKMVSLPIYYIKFSMKAEYLRMNF